VEAAVVVAELVEEELVVIELLLMAQVHLEVLQYLD
tara:strand:+ start:402 stop:509 length:108 start_codon:yes stop_codon:yes gene_type:complete